MSKFVSTKCQSDDGKNILKIPIEASRHKMSEDGLSNFYWPYTRKEAVDFEECLSERYCKRIATGAWDKKTATLLKIMQKYFTVEAVGLFQGCLLKQRSQKDGVVFDFDGIDTAQWRLWPAILEGNVPEKPDFHKKLIKGPVQPSKTKKIFSLSFFKNFLKILNLKKEGVFIDGLAIKILTSKTLLENIISTQRLPLISQHAGETEETVVFSRSERFFSFIYQAALDQKKSEISFSDLDDLITIFRKTALENGAVIDDALMSYFINLCYEQYCALSIHFDCLLNPATVLPKHLWIGTGGHTWDALLACAVRLRGGRVCGHDHGSGLAHVSMGFSAFIDLWLCDEYWTFSEGQAEGLRESVLDWGYMGGGEPIINFPLQEKRVHHLASSSPCNRDSKKTIYIISTIYDRDRGRHCPLMPDMAQIDWQARLVSKLKKWGYNVVIKSHPESGFLPPAGLEKLGAKIQQEPFESVLKEADMFLFDFIYTSVFRAAMGTNKPIIITDFENIPWTDNALTMIRKRCSIEPGYFDDDNRVQINWNKLRISIEGAFERKVNHEFLSYYYNDPLIC